MKQNSFSYKFNIFIKSHLACEEERVDMAKFLLQHGANPFAKNKEEKTPIDASQGGLAYLLPSNKQEE